jgi:mRNA-degrading endonuclease RelE of RelBE toxin-antitoxin system
MLLIYRYDDRRDVVTVVTIEDARTAAAATAQR